LFDQKNLSVLSTTLIPLSLVQPEDNCYILSGLVAHYYLLLKSGVFTVDRQ